MKAPMKFKRLFSKKNVSGNDADDDDKSQPVEDILSDDAQPDATEEQDQSSMNSHRDVDWTEWSVNSSQKDGDDELVPLNDADADDSENKAGNAGGGSASNDQDSVGAGSVESADAALEQRRKEMLDTRPMTSKAMSMRDLRDMKAADGDDDSSSRRSKEKKKKKKESKKKKTKLDASSAAALTSIKEKDLDTQSAKETGDERSVNSRKKKKKKKDGTALTDKPKKKKKRRPKSGLGTDESLHSLDGSELKDEDETSKESVSPKRKKERKKKSKILNLEESGQSFAGFDIDDDPKGLSRRGSDDTDGKSGDSQIPSIVPIPMSTMNGALLEEKKDAGQGYLSVSLHGATGHTVARETDLQRAEILRLQQQLSEALQKVVMTTEEQIQDKDQFLRVSTELAQLKAQHAEVNLERNDLKEKLKERESTVEKSMERIDKLESAIERQLDTQDRLEAKLERSEDEIEKLLIEIHDLEAHVDKSESGGDANFELIRTELKDAKKLLIDKDREIEDQKSRVKHLESELEQTATVNKLQLDELEGENRALQGKLKAEKLESTNKIARKDEIIGNLQKELDGLMKNSEFQDLTSVRQELSSVQEEGERRRNETQVAEQRANKLKSEKEELLERNNVLNDKVRILQKNVNELTEKSKTMGEKVLQWTEKTYEWKSRAEAAEKKLENLDSTEEGLGGSDNGEDDNPQGLFLQAAMDRKETTGAAKKNKWRLFGSGANTEESEELTAEDIRIKTLEERNDNLEETITELRSVVSRLQTTHKEELSSAQKKVAQLQGENEALTLKNDMLEQISRIEEEKEAEAEATAATTADEEGQ